MKSHRHALRNPLLWAGVLWLVGCGAALGQRFQLHGVTVELTDVTADVDVYYRSMRLNRAAGVWNVEVLVSNKSSRVLSGPLVYSVDGFTNTAGPLQPDGVDEHSKAFYDLSANVPQGDLLPKGTSLPRTLSLGFQSNAAPRLFAKVFAPAPRQFAGLNVVRTLDDAGLPLPSVTMDGAAEAGQTDAVLGFATLTPTNASGTLRFSAPGFHPVWRIATVTSNGVGVIPYPRLTKRDESPTSITPITGGQTSRGQPPIEVSFTPGAFSQESVMHLSALTGQTLPLFLPPGWSPLGAFWLELSVEPSLSGTATVTPSGTIAPGETAVFVRLNTNTPAWEVLQLVSGNGSNALNVVLPGSGAYALVLPDSAPIAPPNATVGSALLPSTTPSLDPTNLRANGTVTPAISPASKKPELVTATAEVIVTNLAGNLPSATLLRGEVSERYVLRDGTRRFPALFDNFVVAYQRPGDTRLDTARAEFPVRPLLLFGAEELTEAVVHVELFAPGAFNGGIVDTNGGQVVSDGLRVLIGSGDLPGTQVVQLNRLSVTNFTELAGTNGTVVAAFELGVNNVLPGRNLVVQLSGLVTNANFVLARVLARDGLYGLEPGERLHSDSAANLVSDEPASGDKLPGLNGAGQYVLLRVNPAQGLVSGVAKNSSGQPTGGLPVRIANQPWLTFSASDGAFKLLAPAGDATLTVVDPATGDSGTQTVNVPNPQTPVNTQLASVSSGPRVVSVSPANHAAGVSRVTPIVLTFSEPVNPATLLGDGLRLLTPSNGVVSASLSLNLAGAVATLLPVDPLAPSTLFTINLSTNITDLAGLRLEGSNRFVFTTASDALARGPGAQVISHEPINGIARVEGTQGIADPQSPVILVNDTTGQTSTTLSGSDGSFTGEIAASVEDRIRAVFVNQDGTRTERPVGRQVFPDGSVALYAGGGTITNGNAEVLIVLDIPPGATSGRTKFKIEPMTVADLPALTSNTPPESGTVFGVFNLRVEGDPLRAPATITFRPNVSIVVPPGKTEGDFVLLAVTPRVVEEPGSDGPIVAYEILGQLAPVPTTQGIGRFFPESITYQMQMNPAPGMFGLLATPQFGKTEISGRVQAAFFAEGTRDIVPGTEIPLSGATVRARASSGALQRPFGLQRGEGYTISDDTGHFGFFVPPPGVGGHVLVATHPNFPRQFAASAGNPSHPYGGGVITFDLASPPDNSPPSLIVTHSPTFPQVGQSVLVRVEAIDESGPPTNQLAIELVEPATAVALLSQNPLQPNLWTLECTAPAKVVLKARAQDSFGNQRELAYPILFGQAPEPTPPANDPVRPYVVFSQPDANAVGISPITPITLRFNEPIDSDITIHPTTHLTLSPGGGRPVAVFGRDQREVIVRFTGLQNATDYTLTVQAVRDLTGQIMDQNPDTNSPPGEPFILRFRTAPELHGTLPGIEDGGGVVVLGSYAYVIDRATSTLNQYDISIPSQPVRVAQRGLPGPPRALALLPNYSFTTEFVGGTPGPTPPANPRRSDLLAVAGKISGQVDQYLRIYDLRMPLDTSPHFGPATFGLDDSALITRLAWSPPYLVAVENNLAAPALHVLNLQLLLLGDAYRRLGREQLNGLPANSTTGRDANSDGDFVDAGDELPLMGRDLLDFTPGEVDLLSLTPNRNGPNGGPQFLVSSSRFINDVVVDGASGFIGALIGPGQESIIEVATPQIISNRLSRPTSFRSFIVGQTAVDTALPPPVGERYVLEFPGWQPKRALLITAGLQKLVLLNLISLDNQTNSLRVIDVTRPDFLLETAEIPFPVAEFGLLQGATTDDHGNIILSTVRADGEHLVVLDPTRLQLPMPTIGSHPAIVGIVAGAGGGATPFASQPYGTSVASLRNRSVITQTSPLLRLVTGGSNWFNPFSGSDFTEDLDKIRRLPDVETLPVARHGTNSNLVPVDPAFHWQLLFEAPGGAGHNINLAVMSLDGGGNVVLRTNNALPPAVLAEVPLRRLSDDPFSPAFNAYLSRPLVLVNEDLDPNQLATINSLLQRHVLFAGEQIRVGIPETMQANAVLGSFAGVGTVSPSPTSNAPPVRLGVSAARPVTPNLEPELTAEEPVIVKTTVDRINNTSCPGSDWLNFGHNLDCRISLFIDGQPARGIYDELGNYFQVYTNVQSLAGAHRVLVDAAHVSEPGEHHFELVATEFDGQPANVTRTAPGSILHQIEINQTFPIGHTVINGVDIWDGHLTHTRQDVVIPGRRLSLDFTRTYSSAGDESDGPLGAGWTHSYNIRVVESCGRFTVIGGEGSGNAFVNPATNTVLAARYAPLLTGRPVNREFFKPQIGYHSTLVRYPDDLTQLDFFTKAGIRYHFEHQPGLGSDSQRKTYALREIREPNGNRLILEYEADGDRGTLDSVIEVEGGPPGIHKRALVFEYQKIFRHQRIVRLTGFNHVNSGNLLGLEILYRYDEVGNLTNVVRGGSAAPNDERVETYTYTPDDFLTGHNLLTSTDPNGNVTRFEYHSPTANLPGFQTFFGDAFEVSKHEVVRSITRVGDPALNEDVVTRFDYDFVNRTRAVSDPRESEGVPPTRYTLNLYGATVKTEAPLGQTTEVEWATDVVGAAVLNESGQPVPDVLMIRKVDAEGREHRYEYTDGRGNLTREVIRFPSGKAPVTRSDGVTVVNETSTTYTFDSRFNQRTSLADAEGNSTTYTIDSNNGNLTAVKDAENNVTGYSYFANGDLRTRADPRGGFQTDYLVYDPFGNPTSVRDAAGNLSTQLYDERSRLMDTFDTVGHHAQYAYDRLDRRIREEKINALAASGPGPVVSHRFKPNGELEATTNGLGHVTRHFYDTLNRKTNSVEENVVQVTGAPVSYSRSVRYDKGSNPVLEIDPRGITRINSYDHLNRRVGTTLLNGPSTPTNLVLFGATYDRVGNLLSETNVHGFATTYVYDGLYRIFETQLPFPGAVVSNRYDRMGNKVIQTDANGKAATMAYDRIYRLLQSRDADGNTVTNAYDRASNKILECNLSSGLITEFLDIDGLCRPQHIRKTVPLGGTQLTTATYDTRMEYRDNQNTVVITNPRGFKTRTVKDGLDRIYQAIVDDGGLNLTSTSVHDPNGNTKTVQDAQNGDIDVTHDYDGLNRRIRSTYVGTPGDTGVVKEEFVYDENGNVVRRFDKRGVEFRSTHDNLNRALANSVIETISNGGQELILNTTAYDDPASTVRFTDANGNITVTYNDELGRPRRVDDPDPGDGTVFQYDGVNKIAELDKKGQRTVLQYDDINRLTGTLEFDAANTLRTTMGVQYQDELNRKLTTDRRGIQTISQSDALGRLVQSLKSHSDMGQFYGASPVLLETREYDGNGNLTNIVDGVANHVTYAYDSADRKTSMVEGAGAGPVEAATSYTYDKANNLLAVKDGRAHGGAFDVRYTYDARYRRVTAENGESEATKYRFDPNNNVVRVEEPLGATHATEYRYDELDKLIAVDETPRDLTGVTAGVTRFFYDGNRNKIAQQDASANLVTYHYDGLNRLTNTSQHTVPGSLTDGTVRGPSPTSNPAGGNPATALAWSFGYDLNGNQNLVIDPRGQRADLTYDWLDRLTNRSYSHPDETNLDFQVQSLSYQYDGNGNLERVAEVKSFATGTITEQTVMTYDPLDRMRSRARFDHDFLTGKTNVYAYDLQGNRTMIVDPDGIQTDYTYDQRNRLRAVTNVAGVTQYDYWEDSLLKSCRYPNNTVCDRSDGGAYDRADRLLHVINRPVATNLPPFSTYAYAYDANGNRTNQVELQQAFNGGASEQTVYTYDRLNRLQTVTYATNGNATYTYAPNGNRLTEQGTDPVTKLPVNRKYHYEPVAGNTNTFDRVNALSRIEDLASPAQTVDYHYDRNLNQTSRNQAGISRSFRYDIRDQILQTVQDGSAVSFDYNHDRLRVKKVSGAGETRYLYDQASVLVEYGGAASAYQTIRKYDYGYELLSISRPAGTPTNRESDFFLLDGLTSTANLTGTNGALKHSYLYDAWGRVRTNSGTSDNPRQYTGHYKDEETGLHYFGARYYDDETGRFLSQDSYLGEASTPPSLHRYLYAYANPLRNVDLTGYAGVPIQMIKKAQTDPEVQDAIDIGIAGVFIGMGSAVWGNLPLLPIPISVDALQPDRFYDRSDKALEPPLSRMTFDATFTIGYIGGTVITFAAPFVLRSVIGGEEPPPINNRIQKVEPSKVGIAELEPGHKAVLDEMVKVVKENSGQRLQDKLNTEATVIKESPAELKTALESPAGIVEAPPRVRINDTQTINTRNILDPPTEQIPPPGLANTKMSRTVITTPEAEEVTRVVKPGEILSPEVLLYRGSIDRDVLPAVYTEEGIRSFYRSSGQNSGKRGEWLPHRGVDYEGAADFPMLGIVNKVDFTDFPPGHPLNRYGTQHLKDVSQLLGGKDIPKGRPVSADELNQVLYDYGIRPTPARRDIAAELQELERKWGPK